jgi:hypothetical protein
MAFDNNPALNRLDVTIHIAIVPPRMTNWRVNASSVPRRSPPIEEPFRPFLKIPKNRRLFSDESGVGRDDGEGEEGGLLLLFVVIVIVLVDGYGFGDGDEDVSFSTGCAPRSAGCRAGSDQVGLELVES